MTSPMAIGRTNRRGNPLFLLIISITGFLSSRPSAAQSLPVRDEHATAMLKASVDSMGLETLPPLTSVKLTATATGQADGVTSQLIWHYQASSEAFEMRRETSGAKGTRVMLSGHGKPALIGTDGGVHALPKFVGTTAQALEFPALVLAQEYNNPHCQVISDTSADGSVAVTITNLNNLESRVTSKQVWSFDQATHLPASVVYLIPHVDNQLEHDLGKIEYSDYVTEAGIAHPRKLNVFRNGTLISSITITAASLNPNLPSSLFDQR